MGPIRLRDRIKFNDRGFGFRYGTVVNVPGGPNNGDRYVVMVFGYDCAWSVRPEDVISWTQAAITKVA